MMKSAMSTLCAATLTALAAIPCVASARDYLGPGTFGVGAQVHRFVLLDPLTDAPMPRARYRLFLPDHKIAGMPPGHSGVIFGVTDSRGRTASVRFPRRYAKADWILDPIAGDGDNGESFHLTGHDGADVAKLPYVLDFKGSYLFCGQTSSRGSTYYVQSQRPQAVSLYTTTAVLSAPDFAWCKRVADAITGQSASQEAGAVFRAMLAHYLASEKELGADLLERVRQKLVELAIASRDSRQFDIAFGLGGPYDLNGIGYDLIEANWMVERATGYVDAALAQAPDDPNILDSKGWGLFRLGQSEEALAYFERSIAAFGAGDDDKLAARSAVLVHKGEALWQLGRQEEARQVFATAATLAADDTTLSETLARLHIDLPAP